MLSGPPTQLVAPPSLPRSPASSRCAPSLLRRPAGLACSCYGVAVFVVAVVALLLCARGSPVLVSRSGQQHTPRSTPTHPLSIPLSATAACLQIIEADLVMLAMGLPPAHPPSHLTSASHTFHLHLQIIEADLVMLAMGFLGPEATLAESLGE